MLNKKLLKLIGKERKYIVYIVFFKIISLLVNCVMIFKIANYVNFISLNQFKFKEIFILFIYIILFQILNNKLQAILSYKISDNIKIKLREKLFNKMYSYGMNYSEKAYPAEIVQLSVEGIEQLDIYFGKFIPQFIYSFIAPTILFFILAPINFKAALVLFFIVPIIPLSIVKIQKLAKKTMKNYWSSYVDLSEIFLDYLRGMTVLKVYKADGLKNDELNAYSEEFRKDTMKVLSIQLNNITLMDLMSFGGSALGIIISLYAYSLGDLDLRGVIIFTLISAEFFLPVRFLGSLFHVAMNGMAAADKLFDILNLEEDDKEYISIETDNIDIELRNLSFSYRDGKSILKNINMVFKSGNITSIVGKSGCGKSTIGKLLIGTCDKKSGNIYFNEQENVSKLSLSEKITMVTNDPYFFKGTLRYNLLIAKQEASDDELLLMLEKLDLKDYFLSLEGLDTFIEEGASNLSGGQKQRLAIARALLKNSGVYILDEATSNIDAKSEKIIMKSLKKYIGEKTIILISHRLTNSQNSEYIYYLEDGQVKQEGSFKDLSKNEGSFKFIYDHQLSLEKWGGGYEN